MRPTTQILRILLIDDEPAITESLHDVLRHYFQVDAAHTGQRGLQQATEHKYDAIVLDYNLTDTTGLHVCQELRRHSQVTPILMLTGRNATLDKVQTLNAGADDYLTKPFEPAELVARIRAVMRRRLPRSESHILYASSLRLNTHTHRVSRGNHSIVLPPKTFKLLELLMRHKNAVVSRHQIADYLWEDREPRTNTLDTQVRLLRQYIDNHNSKKMIKTVFSVGYMLEAPEL
jgi:DNA-binding response OmpR family regulator